MTSPSAQVHAVVVTYNPDWDVLGNELKSLEPQVQKIWLVDNASTISLIPLIAALGFGEKICLIRFSDNLGLGIAQNTGIQRAKTVGASHILILDQDSQPMPDMVENLLHVHTQLTAQGVPVAVVAPVYSDLAKGEASGFVKLHGFYFKNQAAQFNQELIEADFVISSGSLISVEILDQVGLMDEDLFIDHVDTEWCLRAKSKGYQFFGVVAARMFHTLGDRRTRIWFFRWRNVSHHSSFRYYYMLRNSLLLQRRTYIPIQWRIADFLRSVRIVFFYGFFVPHRKERLRMMRKGIIDGLRGVSGRMPS